MDADARYDVVIVGAGISGALIAKKLGEAGKRVLILEAGVDGQGSYAGLLERFYLAQAKVPETPYLPPIATAGPNGIQSPSDPSKMAVGRPSTLMLSGPPADDEGHGPPPWQDPSVAYLDQRGPLAFTSTYERGSGGTARHWLGTCLRFLPNDFRTKTLYGRGEDWPIAYGDLEAWYGKAEAEIGVAAMAADQDYLGITFPSGYAYPMPAIPASMVDQAVEKGIADMPKVEGITLKVSNTPAGRNSIPYQNRRQCAGNTNCIPICPIQAKYDPTVTLYEALQFQNVTIMYQTVASEVLVGADGRVSGIQYLRYSDPEGPVSSTGRVTATRYVIACHAIETPRLLLMSRNGGATPQGVANSSGCVGKHLMDHPIYLSWALTADPVYGYRGPLSTAGIESMRDGAFRKDHAPFRLEIGNEGWNFPIGDPYTTTLDFVLGTNVSDLNPGAKPVYGRDLVQGLNVALTRQFRLGALVEQSPEDDCNVTLSDTFYDRLGLQRPRIRYDLSPYTKMGFVFAKRAATAIYGSMKATEYTAAPAPSELGRDPTVFSITYDENFVPVPDGAAPPPGSTTEYFRYFGAGHIVGTYRMGADRRHSVVDLHQRSWDHPNLFLVGSGVFPTVATGNPTLTIAALALWASQTIAADLDRAHTGATA